MSSCVTENGAGLGRNPSHQRALKKFVACALFLTERDAEFDENKPKVKGRIITTTAKAKEVRPLVEKCVTIACKGLAAEEAAWQTSGTTSERGSDAWKELAAKQPLERVERGYRPGRRRPPPLFEAPRRQSKPSPSCSKRWPPATSTAPAATRESSSSPSPAWAMRASGRSSNSRASATAPPRASAPPSTATPPPKAANRQPPRRSKSGRLAL